MPCSEKRARTLLANGRARVHRLYPFTIRLINRKAEDSAFQPITIKIDPGSKITGLAVVRESEHTTHVLNLIELAHRGRRISEALTARRHMRRRRRGTLRYRAPRFLNRTRPDGWLAPSLQHRVDTTVSWVGRLRQWCPISALSQELVRFDMQLIQNPEISGVAYQRGELAGYELREYLLEKWGRTCAYCEAKNVPLQVEHIHCEAKGGSHRASNLTLACGPCNAKKGAQDISVFLKTDQERLDRILAHATRPLNDAAAVNTTRWTLLNALKESGLPVTTGSGGLTKFNRVRLKIPKTHALDAVCVGTTEAVMGWQKPTLAMKATGRGSYQRTRLDHYGFPRGYLTREKRIKGFQTGDMVIATVPKGRKAGIYSGRVAVRAIGRFNIHTAHGLIQGVGYKYCTRTQRSDGYAYA